MTHMLIRSVFIRFGWQMRRNRQGLSCLSGQIARVQTSKLPSSYQNGCQSETEVGQDSEFHQQLRKTARLTDFGYCLVVSTQCGGEQR